MKVLAVIPARGGSKKIPRKNIVHLLGRPLIAWSLDAVKGSKLVERTVLSSDDDEIIEVVKSIGGAEVLFRRPKELAQDDTPGVDVVLHAVEWMIEKEDYRPDAVLVLQPTSPLRRAEHIDAAIELLQSTGVDSVVSVVKVPHNMIPESLMRKTSEGFLEPLTPIKDRDLLRQKKPVYFARNGAAIYLVKTDVLLKDESLFGKKIVPLEMSREESIDIDEPFDLEICTFFLSRRKS